jgi:parallel beta-helix repeat protein
MKKIFTFCLLLTAFCCSAQYRLSFVQPNVIGNKFRITIKMSAITPFSLGSSNLRFNFPNTVIYNPTVLSTNFPSPQFTATNTLGTTNTTGIVSLNTNLNSAYIGQNTLPITTSGVDLVTVEFDILNSSGIVSLTWRISGSNPKCAVLDDAQTAMTTVTTNTTDGYTESLANLGAVGVTCSTLNYPSNGAISIPLNPLLSWTSATNATGYKLNIGTTSGGGQIVNNQDLGNVTSYQITTPLAKNTLYYVKITPYNANGSPTCTASSFTTGNVPSCATASSPSNNSTNIAINPTITWSSVSSATGYKLKVGTTSGGSDIINQDVGNVTSYSLSNLAYSTKYYINITPYNAIGDASGCSVTNFTTVANILNCTTITYPSNGATNVPTSTTVTWNSINGATGYKISYGTNSNADNTLNNLNIGNASSYLLNNLVNNQLYFVKVVPYNNSGNATNCQVYSFTTINVVPNCSTITYPPDNAINISTLPSITWASVNNATSYRVSLGTNTSANNILDNLAVGNVTSYQPAKLQNSQLYYLKITPYNNVGDAIACSISRFTTVVPVPSCATLTYPANNAIKIPTDITISWNVASDATGYKLMLGTTSGSADFLNKDVGNVTTFALKVLENDKQYFVKIVPYNGIGDAVSCPTSSFTTIGIPPTCNNITYPNNEASNIPTTVSITWSKADRATGYLLSYGTNQDADNILKDKNIGNVAQYQLNSLQNATKYYVKITPFNTYGNASNCSINNFTTIYPLGTIAKDSVWALKNSPYLVQNTITIIEGVKLTIEPGVIIKSLVDVNKPTFIIKGTIKAEGTTNQPIVFTSKKDDFYGGDTNNDGNATIPASKDWSSIQILESSKASSLISNCIFRFGAYTNGVIYTVASNPTIINNKFFKCQFGIEVASEANPIINNNIFEECSATPVVKDLVSSPNFTNNTFVNNALNGIGLINNLSNSENFGEVFFVCIKCII